MSKEELFAELGCGTLNDYPSGTFFVITSVQPVLTGEGTSQRDDILVGVSRYLPDNDDRVEENIVIPGRLKPQLKPERLPLIGRYNGKRKSKDGKREYHDVLFMRGYDRRVTSLCLRIGHKTGA